jgi:hypothetical protein
MVKTLHRAQWAVASKGMPAHRRAADWREIESDHPDFTEIRTRLRFLS